MIQLLGDCPPDPYKGSALGRHWILPSPDPYFCTFRGGMATGLKTSSCFDKVASILLPFLATMSPVSVTLSRLLATMSPFLATLSLVWKAVKAITTRFCFTDTLEGVSAMPRGLHSRLCHAFLVTNCFSGPGRTIGLVCLFVCVSGQ